MKILSIALLSVLAVLLSTSLTSACSCIYLPDAQSKYDNAAFVFSGEVKSIEFFGTSGSLERKYIATFEAYEYWKSSGPDLTIDVWAYQDSGANCGYNIQEDTEYLIYAYRDSETGKITTNSCMGSVLLSEAQNEIEDLNNISPPKAPVAINENEPPRNALSSFFSWLKKLFS